MEHDKVKRWLRARHRESMKVLKMWEKGVMVKKMQLFRATILCRLLRVKRRRNPMRDDARGERMKMRVETTVAVTMKSSET